MHAALRMIFGALAVALITSYPAFGTPSSNEITGKTVPEQDEFLAHAGMPHDWVPLPHAWDTDCLGNAERSTILLRGHVYDPTLGWSVGAKTISLEGAAFDDIKQAP